MYYYNRLQQAGISVDQAAQMAASRGMPQEEIDKCELKVKVDELKMWDINSLYNFTFILKSQTSCELINLLRSYKIVDEENKVRILKQIIRKVILDFKIMNWERRNEIQIDKEKVDKLGLNLDQVNSTISTMLGGSFVNNFNQFGRQYKIYVMADGGYRMRPDDLQQFYSRNAARRHHGT